MSSAVKLLDAHEVAEVLGCSVRGARALMQLMPHVRVSERMLRVRADVLEAWIKVREVTPDNFSRRAARKVALELERQSVALRTTPIVPRTKPRELRLTQPRRKAS